MHWLCNWLLLLSQSPDEVTVTALLVLPFSLPLSLSRSLWLPGGPQPRFSDLTVRFWSKPSPLETNKINCFHSPKECAKALFPL